MKKLIVLVLMLSIVQVTQAASFSFELCKSISEEGLVSIEWGYTADQDFEGSSSYQTFGTAQIIGSVPSSFKEGTHSRVFRVQFRDDSSSMYWEVFGDNWSQKIEVWRDEPMTLCPIDQWKPSAPSISIPANGDGPFLIEIEDAYGHWSLVTDEANPHGIVVYNRGGSVELIGSVGQEINPDHYRLIEVKQE